MEQTQKNLKISIVIPVYNEKDHLRMCLDAIAAQTVKPFEVIVVDNNSTDNSVDIAKSYSFVTVLKEYKQGIVYTRNRGFNAVKSGIIARIDADTSLPPKWVECISSFYLNPKHQNEAWTGGGYFYNLHFSRLAGWTLGQIAYRMNRFLMGHYILWGSNMALPQSMWQKVATTTCLRNDIHEDLDLAIHVHRAGYKVTYHEGIKVGVFMRRVFTNRKELRERLEWWPRTLRVHGINRWVLGYIGAVLLYAGWPLLWCIEKVANLFY